MGEKYLDAAISNGASVPRQQSHQVTRWQSLVRKNCFPESMTLPPETTPLYNHSLTAIETWLEGQGCEQNEHDRSTWQVKRDSWTANLELDVEQIIVSYKNIEDDSGIQRIFPYSLSRQDLENAIFSGP